MSALWQAWAYRLGWTMLHSLWQGAACAVALGAALYLTRRRSPAVRYTLSSAAMAALAVAVVITCARLAPPPLPAVASAVPPPAASYPLEIPMAPGAIPIETPEAERVPAPQRTPSPKRVAERIGPLLPWLAGTWAIGVIALACWNACVWFAVQRLRIVGISAAGAWLESTAARLAEQLGVRRRVIVARSTLAGDPLVIGWWRPMILVPASVLSGLTPAQIEGILAHELAHIRRHDYLVNLLQVALETLLFYHPATWWMSRRVRLEREQCCDDIAASISADRVAYAESLAALASIHVAAGSLALAARGSGGGELIARVRRLLSVRDDKPRRAARAPVVALALLAAIGCVTAGRWHRGPVALAPATTPAAAAALPTLPTTLPTDRIALRVASTEGAAIPVDDVREILVYIDPTIPWMMGPKPEVRERYADGWFTVDASLFAQPGQRVKVTYTSGGATTVATASFPDKGSPRRMTLTSNALPAQAGVVIDESLNAAPDEIVGRVVDGQGKPVAGAIARFPHAVPMRDKSREDAVTTGVDGVFRYPHFGEKGYFYFEVDKLGFAPRWIADLPIGHGFTVQLDDRTRVRGRLTLPGGAPAAGATIKLLTTKPTARADMGPISHLSVTGEADPLGRYDLAVEPGEYEAVITTADGSFAARHRQLVVASGKETALPPQLVPASALTIHAVDSRTGTPIPGLSLYIEDRSPGYIGRLKGSERKTASDGSATWAHVVPGPIILGAAQGRGLAAAAHGRWWTGDRTTPPEDARDESDGLQLEIAGAANNVTVRIEPAARITGVVLAPDGRPLEGVRVDVANVRTGDSRFAQVTDEKGRFVLEVPDQKLPRTTSRPSSPRSYAVVAYDPRRRYANAISGYVGPGPGESADVTVRLTPGGSAKGRVIDRAGKPVARIEVEARASDNLDREYYNPRTITDANGRFNLGPMRPAAYEIFADTNFGVNIVPAPGDKPGRATIEEGKAQAVPDLIYGGPPPSPVPENFDRWYPNAPTTRQTIPATRQANRAPFEVQGSTPMDRAKAVESALAADAVLRQGKGQLADAIATRAKLLAEGMSLQHPDVMIQEKAIERAKAAIAAREAEVATVLNALGDALKEVDGKPGALDHLVDVRQFFGLATIEEKGGAFHVIEYDRATGVVSSGSVGPGPGAAAVESHLLTLNKKEGVATIETRPGVSAVIIRLDHFENASPKAREAGLGDAALRYAPEAQGGKSLVVLLRDPEGQGTAVAVWRWLMGQRLQRVALVWSGDVKPDALKEIPTSGRASDTVVTPFHE